MAILKVTPEQVRGKAGELRSRANAMRDDMQAMENFVNRLPSEYWKSQSGQNYKEKYNAVRINCMKALETLERHARNLVEAANKYDEVERAQVASVSQLNTMDIFK